MQNLLNNGALGKCGISEGDNADIQGCLPNFKKVIDDLDIDSANLCYTKIMGTALINSYSLTGEPSGGLLILENSLKNKLTKNIITRKTKNNLLIDWIHTTTKYLNDFYQFFNISQPTTKELKNRLLKYLNKHKNGLSNEWTNNTILYNGCD